MESAEYRLHINAFSPDTIPMERLAEYLSYLAKILGEKQSVHFLRLEGGSTTPVVRVEREAIPKVRERLHLVRADAAPHEARNAFDELNKRLAGDNARGELLDAEAQIVLVFRGVELAREPEFGPIVEGGSFQGIPIRVGGEKETVPVHLQDGDIVRILYAPRRIAKEIAKHLFASVVRAEGKGRWMRNRWGEWDLLHFFVADFQVLEGDSIQSELEALRTIDADWKKLDDPIDALQDLRHGELAS